MLGELFDAGRGQGIALAYDPLTDLQQSQLAAGLRPLLLAALLFAGGAEAMLGALERSFALVPGGGFPAAGAERLGLTLLSLVGAAFAAVLQVFLPFALLFFAADTAMGFVGKVLPGAGLFAEAFQLKTYLGLALLPSPGLLSASMIISAGCLTAASLTS